MSSDDSRRPSTEQGAVCGLGAASNRSAHGPIEAVSEGLGCKAHPTVWEETDVFSADLPLDDGSKVDGVAGPAIRRHCDVTFKNAENLSWEDLLEDEVLGTAEVVGSNPMGARHAITENTQVPVGGRRAAPKASLVDRVAVAPTLNLQASISSNSSMDSGVVPVDSSPSLSPPAPAAPRQLCDLPSALLLEILSLLDAKDLGRLSCCSKHLSQLAADSPGWQRLYCDRWRPPPAAALPRQRSHPSLLPHPSETGRAARHVAPAPSVPHGGPQSVPSSMAAADGTSRQDGGHRAARHDGPYVTKESGSPEWWRQLYLHKEKRSAALLGRYEVEWSMGHTAGVRCVAILPQAPIAATAGYDSTVRLWDLDRVLPLAASAPLGQTLRAVAADWDFLAVGGTDCMVRVWPLAPGCPHLFDVDGLWDCGASLSWSSSLQNQAGGSGCLLGTPCASSLYAPCSPAVPALFCAHRGPVSCLAASHEAGGPARLFSGSWDHSIACWDVGQFMVCPEPVHTARGMKLRRSPSNGVSDALLQRYQHEDWVLSCVAKGGRIFSGAGAAQYSWDAESGALLKRRGTVHDGKVLAVEASMSAHYVFTAGEDGFVKMFDERLKVSGRGKKGSSGPELSADEPVVTWLAHGASVNSLAFEDPWLVTASGDGCCAVMDVRKTLKADRRHSRQAYPQLTSGRPTFEPSRRLGGGYGGILCIDVGHDRVVCGSSDTSVRVMDFRGAEGVHDTRARSKKKLSKRHGGASSSSFQGNR